MCSQGNDFLAMAVEEWVDVHDKHAYVLAGR